MKSIDLKLFSQQIARGIEISKNSKPILASFSFKTDIMDPLQFFSSGESDFRGKRFFWTDPGRSLYLVGLGHAKSLEVSHSNRRFEQMKKKWQELKSQALVHSESSPQFSGRGPLLFGGFSYDPEKEKTDLWKDYPEGKMVLPRYMLTLSSGEAWLTINLLNSRDDHPESILESVQKELYNLHAENTVPGPGINQVICQKEIDLVQWMSAVSQAAENIRQKKLEKVVMAREMRLEFINDLQVQEVIRSLCREQPTSYIFALENRNSCFIGASPELLIRKKDRHLSAMCLAGSIARGKSIEEDRQFELDILRDEKNLGEHEIVVRMIRQVMEEVCVSTSVPDAPALYKIRDIQHLYTPVTGQAKESSSILDLVEKLHPTPALGGYPRNQSLAYIRKTEILDRGWYAAPIGWMDLNEDGEFAVGIRSGLIRGKSVSLFAGSGIMGDSSPENEYEETQIKFKPMLLAVGGCNDDRDQ